jgi:hypothetical protein
LIAGRWQPRQRSIEISTGGERSPSACIIRTSPYAPPTRFLVAVWPGNENQTFTKGYARDPCSRTFWAGRSLAMIVVLTVNKTGI